MPTNTPSPMNKTSDNKNNKTHAPKRPSAGLLQNTAIVSLMTFMSRILGLARDVVIAKLFGADGSTDAFFIAFRIPNFLRRLFAEGAFAQAFVPVLNEYKQQGSHAAVQLLVNTVAARLGIILAVLTGIFVVTAPWIIVVFAPGFRQDPEQLALAGDMLQITFPYLFFIAMTAFAGGILNSYNRFAVPSFTPVILNIVLISAAFLLSPLFAEGEQAKALAWGVFLAGVLQLLFQVPFLWRLNLLPKPQLRPWQHDGVKKIMTLMLPALFGVSVSQINLLLDSVLASLLEQGSVTWLYYSDRLMELPLGVFGIAVATVILPTLSRQHADKTGDAFNCTLNWAIRMIVLIALPASIALLVLAEPLLIALFNYGKFSADDVMRSAMSLRAYSMGVLAFMLIKVLAPGFYARQDTKTPVKIGIIAMVANMVFNLALFYPLAHAGLALATTLSAFLNAGLLYYMLAKKGVLVLDRGLWVWLVKIALAVALMSAGLLAFVPETMQWLSASLGQRIVWLIAACAGGALVYFAALGLMGLRPHQLKQG